MRCCDCRWWEPIDKGETTELSEGYCHRYPPNVPCVAKVNDIGIAAFETVRGTVLMSYPIVYAPEWCGEFHDADEPGIKEER